METRIVEAVAVAASASRSTDVKLSTRLEKAMSDAVLKAYAENVLDPDEIKVRMKAAHEEAKNAYYQELAAEAEADAKAVPINS